MGGSRCVVHGPRRGAGSCGRWRRGHAHVQGVPVMGELKNETNSVKPGPSVGTTAIGGSFILLIRDGKSVTKKDFLDERIKLEILPVFVLVYPEETLVEHKGI
ncbi:hypothetical protein BRADI_4g18811v3 [Brachypodium distachyon]|uniref:Uncharacterized protein n=1 Tax=Brachypodium distachyon TaxID=15368 RepID=A0A0Q3IQF7_BRADI|nr:hypothetical protein BRADI_4g18811v3 [Brachypodium distachyon]